MEKGFSAEFWAHDRRIDDARKTHFKRLDGVTYLDHAGATLYSECQLKNVYDDLASAVYGNPHSHCPSSIRSTEVIEDVRHRVLRHFNVTSDEYAVIFTSNCTAALKVIAETFNFGDQKSCVPENDLLNSSSEEPLFAYLADNHTSVVGMREIMKTRNVTFQCVTETEVRSFANELHSGQERFTNGVCTGKKACVNNLLAFPAQSNFSGQRYPLSWIQKVKGFSGFANRHGNWHVLLDAASFLTTATFDLRQHRPDFVVLSFYKIFGFPTGLSALLVNRSSTDLLQKTYFGGGTVKASLATEDFHVKHDDLHHRFEDGTVPFLEILAVKHGLESLLNVTGSLTLSSTHSFALAQYVHGKMAAWRYRSGRPLAVLYHSGKFESAADQGPIVNFNLMNSDGSFIGFAQVEKLAQLYNIHFRTGCFCNMGACAQHLSLSADQVKDNLKAGHVCGDDIDLIDGRPTGSIRISFGYCSTFSDAETFLRFIQECFLETQTESSRIETTNVCNGVDDKGKETNLGSDFFGDSSQYSVATDEPMTLAGIRIYPVKSCGSLAVTEGRVGPRGFVNDRELMVLNETGVCISQKREPLMSCIQPSIDTDRNCLTLSYQGLNGIKIPLQETLNEVTSGQMCSGKVCGSRVTGCDCGDEAAEWLQSILQKPNLRLVRQNNNDGRTVTRNKTGQNSETRLSLANEAQYLLIGTASVSLLLSLMKSRVDRGEVKKEDSCLDYNELVERFRPNLIVKTRQPFEEEGWSRVQIGPVTFVSEGPCSRCQMVCVDQKTGKRTKEPLLSLVTLLAKKNTFGVLLQREDESSEGQLLSVGDVVMPLLNE